MRGHPANLVGRSTEVLASAEFNETSACLHISGVREMNPSLFEMLAQAGDLAEAGEAFLAYMRALFALDPEQRGTQSPRRYRSSFLRLIQGWGFDSNSPEGAVLKGWVESRFGLCPTFHREPITRVGGRAWATYVEEKMSSRFHNNAISSQLDLLYEFSQWARARFFAGQTHLTLFRGVNGGGPRGEAIIALNNLVSFSSDRDVAGCFGDAILEARVPTAKLVFFNQLLPSPLLRGEGEHLVVGGDYRVRVDYL